MPVDLTIRDAVKQLRRVGLRPSQQLVQHILDQGQLAVGPLQDLAAEVALLHEDEPACWAPIHALRLLGELRTAEIIVPLLGLLPIELHAPEERPVMMWVQELPQIVGHVGEPAVAPLQQLACDNGQTPAARHMAISALSYAAVAAPDQHDAIVTWLRDQLRDSEDPVYAGHLVLALAQLGVSEAYPEIMNAYRAGRIDKAIVPPGAARQWLLSKIEKRLSCVSHPLWERYDEHGPYTKEQYELMDQMREYDNY